MLRRVLSTRQYSAHHPPPTTRTTVFDQVCGGYPRTSSRPACSGPGEAHWHLWPEGNGLCAQRFHDRRSSRWRRPGPCLCRKKPQVLIMALMRRIIAAQTGASRSSRVSSRSLFARSSGVVRRSSRTLLARSSRVVRTLLVRCSYAVRTRSSHF